MKQKKVPLRQCVVTRNQYPKKDLLRIVRSKDGIVHIDPSGKLPGRGAYIFMDPKLVDQAQKTQVLARALNIEIPDPFYEELKQYISHQLARRELFSDDR